LISNSTLPKRLTKQIWGDQSAVFSLMAPTDSKYQSYDNSSAASFVHLPLSEKDHPNEHVTEVIDVYDMNSDYDAEAAKTPESVHRPTILTSSVMVGCGLFLIIILMLGFGLSTLVYEYLEDGNYLRFLLLICLPASISLSLFFFIVVFGNFFQAFGPISSLQTNSRYNSPIKPNLTRALAEGMTLPLITIQMPVYKEGLEGVIMPTIESLRDAISHYESRGGKIVRLILYKSNGVDWYPGAAKILINDDGLACIPKEDAEKRRAFYRDNNIAWVARPKHGDNFIRKGKFKKASNMNYALNLSLKVEDAMFSRLQQYEAHERTDLISSYIEEQMYRESLAQVLKENPRAEAEGDIRIGEIILIIDSDTRVVSQMPSSLR
jgi:hypothetical protein